MQSCSQISICLPALEPLQIKWSEGIDQDNFCWLRMSWSLLQTLLQVTCMYPLLCNYAFGKYENPMTQNLLPSLTPVGSCIQSRHDLDWTKLVLQHAHDEWSSVRRWQEAVQPDMLPYVTDTIIITFPWWCVLWWLHQYWYCVSDYPPRCATLCCQWHSHSVDINIAVGYPEANNSSTKDTFTRYLPRPEVLST